MANIEDAEKRSHVSASASPVTPSLDVKKDSHSDTTPSSRPTTIRHSHDSIDSNASDPLEPLERGLTIDEDLTIVTLPHPYRTHTALTVNSVGTTGSKHPDFEVDFEPDDPDNPRNWPVWYKGLTIGAIAFATWVTIMYSTSYTSSMPGMMKDFGVTSEPVTTLGVTSYLVGMAVGGLFLAPLSEIYGRRLVYTGTFIFFVILVIPCALATSLPEVIVVRFLGALFGSCVLANAPGTLSDISDEAHRALAFSIWSIGPMNGPVTGPLIGGFTYEYLGWRWTNWLVLILSGASWIFLSCIKETYAPAILQRKAAQRRKETGDDRWWSRYDQKLSIFSLLKVNLARPFIMAATEPILWFWNLYIGVVYGILYLCFVAYPLIFSGYRGWSPGFTGLAFCGIGLGTLIIIACEPLIRRVVNMHAKDPKTGRAPPEAQIFVLCIAAFLAPIGQLIFSWTSTPITIHWIWSILAGIPFGAGTALIFIYSANYVAGSYGIYAASSLASTSVVRSLFGGTLPLAGPSMYAALGPRWAGTLLGLLEVILIPIPFVFYKWGNKIREKSPLISQMRADQERIDQRNSRHVRGAERSADVEAEPQATGVQENIVEKA